MWNFEIDVLQVMNACAANYDRFLGHIENGRANPIAASTSMAAIYRLPNLTIIVRLEQPLQARIRLSARIA